MYITHCKLSSYKQIRLLEYFVAGALVRTAADGVRSIWLRHNLHNFRLRLRVLEKIFVQQGIVLTEAQV